MNGFLNLYKPKGVSSAHLLNKVKKIINCKCGHMGTLDPLACGVLPVGIGQATRLFDRITADKRKKYIAEFTFGFETDTLDLEGTPVFTSEKIPSKDEIIYLLPDFLGEIAQVPPAFSAKCIDGKKSYKLARKGIAAELPPKNVMIYEYKLLGGENGVYRFEIECGGGTYIRALARDLGRAAGSRATMTALERTECGIFTKENSVTIDQLEQAENFADLLIKSEDVLHYPRLDINAEQGQKLLNGLPGEYALENGDYKLFCNGEFWGVAVITDRQIKVKPYVRD